MLCGPGETDDHQPRRAQGFDVLLFVPVAPLSKRLGHRIVPERPLNRPVSRQDVERGLVPASDEVGESVGETVSPPSTKCTRYFLTTKS